MRFGRANVSRSYNTAGIVMANRNCLSRPACTVCLSPGRAAVMQLISPRYLKPYSAMDQVAEEQADGKLQITNSTAKTHGCFVAASPTYFSASLARSLSLFLSRPFDSWLQFPGQRKKQKKKKQCTQVVISVRRIYKQLYANKEKQATSLSHNNRTKWGSERSGRSGCKAWTTTSGLLQ